MNTSTVTPGTRVTLPDLGSDTDVRGTVLDPTNSTPEDVGMVLVLWSPTSVRWEYVEDLLVVPVATPVDPDHPDSSTHLFTRCRCGNTIHRTTTREGWTHYQTGDVECAPSEWYTPEVEEERTPREWVEDHRSRGHDATVTQVAAPGYGTGSYCHTCHTYGPRTGGILSEEDVR